MHKLKQNKQKFSEITEKLNIDESQTKTRHKPKQYNKFAASIVPEPDFNYQADLLHLPTTKQGYKYVLVMTDLATNKFDIQSLKTTSSSESTKAIVKRGILKLPEVSIKTDGGSEFKQSFNEYLEKHGIYHSIGTADRKNQMAPVERLNRDLGRLFNGYMNKIEQKTKKPYCEWTDIVDTVRSELNQYRERDISKLREYQSTQCFDTDEKSKFKEGDIVQYMLLAPVGII